MLYKNDDVKKIQLDRLVALMIAKDFQPLTIVTHSRFRSLMSEV